MATLSSTGRFAAGEACADNDILYGPYATIAAAHAALLNAEQNVVGRTVGIQTGNTIEEYWYQGGTGQANLVRKQSSEVEANPTGTPTVTLEKIKIGNTIYTAPAGVGIANIEKTGTSGLVDTYTITLTNGNKETFTVTNGANGASGANGLPAYVHIKYADDASGTNMSSNPDGKSYIGILSDNNPSASSTASDYTWAKFVGADGADGENGPANTITIGTVEGGETAGASMSGESPNQVLNLVLPKGDKGNTGNPGHNPNLGTFVTSDSGATFTPALPSAPSVASDYIVVVDKTDPSDVTSTIWTWDSSLATPAWASTGRDANMAYFGSGELLSDVDIVNDLTTGGTTNVMSAEQGKVLNDKVVLGYQHIALDHNSPYFTEEITDIYPDSNTNKFVRNQFTSPYRVDLFTVPAGKYMAKLNDSISTFVYVGTVDSVNDVVNNGPIKSSIIDDNSVVDEEVIFSFSEETILFFLHHATFNYYNFAYVKEIKEIGMKPTVLQLQEDVNSLKEAEDIVNLIMSDNETVWQLENDLDWFTSSYYSYKNIGQYTKILDEDTAFSKIRINKIYDVDADYKIYITNAGVGNTRQCPVGVLGNSSSTYTLIKEGHITKSGLGYSDIDIILDNVYTCPSGYQVAIYMVSSSNAQIYIRGAINGNGNPEGTSNASLLCTGSDPFGTSAWAGGTVNEGTNEGYFNVALTLIADTIFVKKDGIDETIEEIVSENLPTMIDSEIATNLDIVIPDTVYAIVGTELNIWNDAVSLSIDKGLQSPMNYQIRWNCNKGLITDRCFRFKPTTNDVGNVSCTCYIYDVRGKLVASKTFTIKVSANDSLNSAKNIVYFGDSLGASAATALYNNFNDSNRFGGTIPTMLGTQGTSNHYEAVGGYKWNSYATAGSTGYRIYVSGVNSMSVGAVYSDGSHTFEVYEVNITEGTGNCLLCKYYTNPGTLIMPSGTLTKVSGSGDSTVPYTDAFQESVNPLWNDTTSQLDINQYKQTLVSLGQLSSVDDKIDAVSFQFGINDNDLANNLATLHTYISDLYDCFINDNANCKFIIGLTTSSGNDVNGSGANYGATWNYKSYLENTYKLRKYYLTLLSEFPNIRIATPNLYLDRYYGYAFGTRKISDRYQVDEQYHTNYVHPATSGYNQMADAYLACYVGVLSE